MDYKIYKKKKKLKIRDLTTKFVVYDYEKGIHVELNESAKIIWVFLDTMSVDEVVDNYAIYYGIDAETANNDVMCVINELEERGLLEKDGEL